MQGKLEEALEESALLTKARPVGSSQLFYEAASIRARASTLFHLGQFDMVISEISKNNILQADLQPHTGTGGIGMEIEASPAIVCQNYLALAYAYAGFLGDAEVLIDKVLRRAEATGHKHTLAITLLAYCMVHHRFHNVPHVLEAAERLVTLAEGAGFRFWALAGRLFLEWARAFATAGYRSSACAFMASSLDIWRYTGAQLNKPLMLLLYAEILCLSAERVRAEEAVVEAKRLTNITGARCWNQYLEKLERLLRI